jgi:DNA helicase II / ATP-dependent DNA helicase PcrA
MTPSKYQLAIYDAIKNTNSNIFVAATAGSGKTTTIIECSKLIPQHLDACFAAFNKSIVEELRSRLPDTVNCQTLHSIGMKSLFSHFGCKLKVNKSKTGIFVNEVIELFKKDKEKSKFINTNQKDLWRYTIEICEIIDFARMNHIPFELEKLGSNCDYYGLIYDEMQLQIAIESFKKMEDYNNRLTRSRDEKMIDFIDMIYIPSTKDVKLPKFDIVFVDEAQDMNICQQILVKKILKSKGRIIYVGDKNQSIYFFAGADGSVFEKLISQPNTICLPLSVSYRCPKMVVQEARKVYQDIEHFEKSPNGIVGSMPWTEIKLNDMVLCRNTAPLISLYFDLLQRGIKSHVKGRELEKQVFKVLSRVRYQTVPKGLEQIHKMADELYDKIHKEGRDPSKTPKYRNFMDIVSIIEIICQEGYELMAEVIESLENIFDETKEGVELMTIHRSKGLERDRVILLNPDLIPSRWASSEEDYRQENNLKFVAITRAKKEFYYSHGYVLRQDRI